MKKILILAILALVAGLLALGGGQVQANTTWYVATTGNDGNDCLSPATACLTIQGAIDKASSDDTINVAVGTYSENVDVYKALTIISESGSPDDTVVRAADSVDHAIHVTASNVTISGLTITGATGADTYGVYLDGVDNCEISKNVVTDNSGGILLTSSNDNLIYDNLFSNTNNAWDDGNNSWNITKTLGTNIIGGPFLGGNYWADYTGEDLDGDGIGDTNLPYSSSGNITLGGDYLPLVLERPVGGVVELLVDGSDSSLRPADGSRSSAAPYALVAGAIAAALALTAGAWYARRRWLR